MSQYTQQSLLTSFSNVFSNESETAVTNVFCSESEASATNVFSNESETAVTNVFCSDSNNTRLGDQHHIGPKPPADVTESERSSLCEHKADLDAIMPRHN
ncbi:hypothetical protein [Lysinibacillus xylanilyticus]|uniref:hypothetical protein n=1 Tax=Lysinibacillus xylanilyticus TaxID=582475 RepID=UPI003824C2C8